MRYHAAVGTIALLFSLAVPTFADSKIKIGTAPAEYTPYMSVAHQPVSLYHYRFEINPETKRARVVATYTYSENMIWGSEDGSGPQPTIAQIPGLTYDETNHAVVYNSGNTRTVCATVEGSKVRNTGACKVTTEAATVTVDDGWDVHNQRILNTYLEIH